MLWLYSNTILKRKKNCKHNIVTHAKKPDSKVNQIRKKEETGKRIVVCMYDKCMHVGWLVGRGVKRVLCFG